eukprot:TRINITY_DN16051_c0_g1_i1.p1 TRINITY_DN16051_c0_g1~~TRINITY_DN16051_c0_g1_i1.p1  ORF type:complete len:136 (+),score=18.92 TRINITY_DN16051_c0_g1_i1:375-782(+)
MIHITSMTFKLFYLLLVLDVENSDCVVTSTTNDFIVIFWIDQNEVHFVFMPFQNFDLLVTFFNIPQSNSTINTTCDYFSFIFFVWKQKSYSVFVTILCFLEFVLALGRIIQFPYSQGFVATPTDQLILVFLGLKG